MYERLCPKELIKKICPLKSVSCAEGRLLGEKNGKIAGMRLSIAQRLAVVSAAQVVPKQSSCGDVGDVPILRGYNCY